MHGYLDKILGEREHWKTAENKEQREGNSFLQRKPPSSEAQHPAAVTEDRLQSAEGNTCQLRYLIHLYFKEHCVWWRQQREVLPIPGTHQNGKKVYYALERRTERSRIKKKKVH